MRNRIFWPKRKEWTAEWRKLYDKKLYNLYFLQNIIRFFKLRRARHVTFEISNKYLQILVTKQDTRCKREGNIKRVFEKWGWIKMVQNAVRWRSVGNNVTNFVVPQKKAIALLTVTFWRRILLSLINSVPLITIIVTASLSSTLYFDKVGLLICRDERVLRVSSVQGQLCTGVTTSAPCQVTWMEQVCNEQLCHVGLRWNSVCRSYSVTHWTLILTQVTTP